MERKDFFRLVEWWNVKVSLFFGVFTLYAVYLEFNFLDYLEYLLKSFALLFPIAAWANIINDYGDVDSDALAGKPNRLSGFSPNKRALLSFGSLPLLFILPYYWLSSFSTWFFLSAIVVGFFMYSVKPFRLKAKQWGGVFMDALSTQVFPQLFMLYFMAELVTVSQIHSIAALLFIWLLSSGLRLHLVHQYQDKENDLKSGVRTLCTTVPLERIQRLLKRVIFPLELLSFLALCLVVKQYYLGLALLVYFAVQQMLKYKLKIKQVLFAVDSEERVWLSPFYDYYLLFTCLLAATIGISIWYLGPMLFFIVIFYGAYWLHVKEVVHVLRWWRST